MQAISDGLKLVKKKQILSDGSSFFIFLWIPVMGFSAKMVFDLFWIIILVFVVPVYVIFF